MRDVCLTLCLVLTGSALPAQSTQSLPPLVARAIRRLHEGKPEVASTVVTHTDVYDGKGHFLGSLETVEALASWAKDGTPRRKEISNRTQGSPGFTMTMSLHLEDHPAEALDGFATWSDAGVAQVAGRTVQRFKGTATSGKDVTEALVAVDPQSGAPVQVDYDLPMHSTFGTRRIKASVVFGGGPDGAWIPSTVTIDQSGRYLFWHRHLVVVSRYQDWIPRP